MEGKRGKVLLVIDHAINWYEKFKKITLSNGEPIIVEQTRWKSIELLESCSEQGVKLLLRKEENPFPFSSQKEDRDFLLVRNFPTGLHDGNFLNIVMGLMFANLPSVNNLHSIFMCQHRPLVHAELLKIQKLLNFKEVSVIPMRYFPNWNDEKPPSAPGLLTAPSYNEYPKVVKVNVAHFNIDILSDAGYGKSVAHKPSDFYDLQSILMMGRQYFTTEPFVDFDYEFRIQKIGKHYRGFKRKSETSWKSNWGELSFEILPLQERHMKWIEECSKLFGGMDICALDVLVSKDGHETIIELNDTAIGLLYDTEKEDSDHIKEVVLERMNQAFCPPQQNAN